MYKITEQKLREVVRKIILREISSSVGTLKKPKLQKGEKSQKLKDKEEKYKVAQAKTKTRKASLATATADYKSKSTIADTKTAAKQKAQTAKTEADKKVTDHKKTEPTKNETTYTYTDNTGKKPMDVVSKTDPGKIFDWTVTSNANWEAPKGTTHVLVPSGFTGKVTSYAGVVHTKPKDFLQALKSIKYLGKAEQKARDKAVDQLESTAMDLKSIYHWHQKNVDWGKLVAPEGDESKGIGTKIDYDNAVKKTNDAKGTITSASNVNVAKKDTVTSGWTTWNTTLGNYESDATSAAGSLTTATNDESTAITARNLSQTTLDKGQSDHDEAESEEQDHQTDYDNALSQDEQDMMTADEEDLSTSTTTEPSGGTGGGQGGGGYGGSGKSAGKGKAKKGKKGKKKKDKK